MLTEAQKKLAEDNHKLVYYYMRKYHLEEDDMINTYGILCEGLVKAASTYSDKQGSSFSHYAMVVMHNAWLTAVKYYKRHDIVCMSLNQTEFDDCEDWIGGIQDYKDYIGSNLAFSAFKSEFNKLSDRNKLIIQKVISGEKQVDIASEFGITKTRVGQLIRWFRERVKENSSY